MLARDSKTDKLQVLFALLVLSFAFTLVSPLQAQTFQTVPAMAFTKAFAGAEPLPQVLTIAYTDQTTVRLPPHPPTAAALGCRFLPLAPVAASHRWPFRSS